MRSPRSRNDSHSAGRHQAYRRTRHPGETRCLTRSGRRRPLRSWSCFLLTLFYLWWWIRIEPRCETSQPISAVDRRTVTLWLVGTGSGIVSRLRTNPTCDSAPLPLPSWHFGCFPSARGMPWPLPPWNSVGIGDLLEHDLPESLVIVIVPGTLLRQPSELQEWSVSRVLVLLVS